MSFVMLIRWFLDLTGVGLVARRTNLLTTGLQLCPPPSPAPAGRGEGLKVKSMDNDQ